ncbi:MAG TPA: DUF374 domain-containing protein [Deltaproteobacteria bacterium]|nr:DUF374 domain-containing protein [Deltaproteobacteria bacterium]
MFKKLRKIATTRAAGIFIYWVIRLYSATFRLKVENENQWLEELEQGNSFMICLWHQQLFIAPLFLARYRKYRLCVMISKSLDGDIATRVVEASGAFVVRGSSSRGGRAALKEMIEALRERRLAAHILDGPRGPAGIVKDGVISMAHQAEAAVLPAAVLADRAWFLKSWDRFMIPKPFAKVTMRYQPKVKFPALKAEEDFENQRKMLENIMLPFLQLDK